jgi:hypothetical protein
VPERTKRLKDLLGFPPDYYPVGFLIVGVTALLLRPDDRNAWLLALLFWGPTSPHTGLVFRIKGNDTVCYRKSFQFQAIGDLLVGLLLPTANVHPHHQEPQAQRHFRDRGSREIGEDPGL